MAGLEQKQKRPQFCPVIGALPHRKDLLHVFSNCREESSLEQNFALLSVPSSPETCWVRQWQVTILHPQKLMRFKDSAIPSYCGCARCKMNLQHNQWLGAWCWFHGVRPGDFWVPFPRPPSTGPPFPGTTLLPNRPSLHEKTLQRD